MVSDKQVMEQLTPAEQSRALRTVAHYRERYDASMLYQAFPATGKYGRHHYPKILEYFRAGKKARLRGMIAANRVGKTFSHAFEIACHLTAQYPDWWEGRRVENPGSYIVAGKLGTTVRDILVPLLIGKVHQRKEVGSVRRNRVDGTGMIPLSRIDQTSITYRAGGQRIVDKVRIAFGDPEADEWSELDFRSFEQGRAAFEGTARDGIWCDEEPPDDVWDECLIRTATTGGYIALSFTPLDGLTDVVLSFLPEHRDVLDAAESVWNPETDTYGEDIETDGMSDDFEAVMREAAASGFWLSNAKFLMRIGWADNPPHLTEEAKSEIEEELRRKPFLRLARTNGLPVLGTGRVYPMAWEAVSCSPRRLPDHWPRFFGFDPGRQKTAAVWFAHDTDADILYVYGEYYVGQAPIFRHARAVKARGKWIPGVMDPAGRTSNLNDGLNVVEGYRREGLKVIAADKSKGSVSAGIEAVYNRLTSGRLVFFQNLPATEMEFGFYRYDEKGKPVKKLDHIMDAVRYGVMDGPSIARTKARANSEGLVHGMMWREKMPENQIAGY